MRDDNEQGTTQLCTPTPLIAADLGPVLPMISIHDPSAPCTLNRIQFTTLDTSRRRLPTHCILTLPPSSSYCYLLYPLLPARLCFITLRPLSFSRWRLPLKGPAPVPKPQSSPLSILITGASRGLGLQFVQQYSQAHDKNIVFAGVRNPASATELNAFAALRSNVHIIPLDVDDEQSIRDSVKHVEKVIDRLDVLINNRGSQWRN